jgi:hypothetical protein
MAERTHLADSDVARLLAEHPELPVSYIRYMRDIGWGESPSGHMIYSAPISPNEVYPRLSNELPCVLIGDDTQGCCLAYDFGLWRYGEFSDFGEWSSFDETFDLAGFLASESH